MGWCPPLSQTLKGAHRHKKGGAHLANAWLDGRLPESSLTPTIIEERWDESKFQNLKSSLMEGQIWGNTLRWLPPNKTWATNVSRKVTGSCFREPKLSCDIAYIFQGMEHALQLSNKHCHNHSDRNHNASFWVFAVSMSGQDDALHSAHEWISRGCQGTL